MAMLGISEIRKGVLLVLDEQPYAVVSAEFLRKQQRRPVVRTVLRNLRTGQTKEHSFQQSDKVPQADVEQRQYQFLYRSEDQFSFMDQVTYEQIDLTAQDVGEATPFLIEGQTVDISFFDGQPVTVNLPIKVDRAVIEAPPGVKGDSSTNVMKDVVIEGGATVKAPLFIEVGDKIRIDTRTGTYVERAKE